MKRYLILENGTVLEGEAFGAERSAIGELVFTTGMCGYMETLTDPSYYGQIVMQTFPLIGNYGVIREDAEGECRLSGYVVSEWCSAPSNFRSKGTVDEFLKEKGIPGIYGLDTRHITKIIRDSGVMNAMITDSVPSSFDKIRAYTIKDAVKSVTCSSPEVFAADNAVKSGDGADKKAAVALIDYGAKHNIVRELVKRGCEVTVYPSFTTAEEILAASPDGVMLSNGPGDPAENKECIAEIAKLCGKVPIFGICLGHQLLALANGGRTFKLRYGHRGVNQPAREADGVRTYITSQNHGYAVDPSSIKNGSVSFFNANDGTCEGMNYPSLNAFSVQFHPEACSGPRDTSFLFDSFIKIMVK